MTHRLAVRLELPKDNFDEYERRHQRIWPEIAHSIRDKGGHNYSIFAARELDSVFIYVEVDDIEQWQTETEPELANRWWAHMADLMPTNSDGSPRSHSMALLYHQD